MIINISVKFRKKKAQGIYSYCQAASPTDSSIPYRTFAPVRSMGTGWLCAWARCGSAASTYVRRGANGATSTSTKCRYAMPTSRRSPREPYPSPRPQLFRQCSLRVFFLAWLCAEPPAPLASFHVTTSMCVSDGHVSTSDRAGDAHVVYRECGALCSWRVIYPLAKYLEARHTSPINIWGPYTRLVCGRLSPVPCSVMCILCTYVCAGLEHMTYGVDFLLRIKSYSLRPLISICDMMYLVIF
jgi:hypothetical protein